MRRNSRVSVFSWHQKELRTPRTVFQWMDQVHLDTIFQAIDPEDSKEEIRLFLEHATAFNKIVYFLAGEPEWALDEKARETIRFISSVLNYKSPSLKGIVLDVEPYLLPEFRQNADQIMGSYLKGMSKAYQVAHRNNLEVILCIPYYFDTWGFISELNQLIKHAADCVAVMNYYRGKEISHLQTEAQLSFQYDKPIITIYELLFPTLFIGGTTLRLLDLPDQTS